MLELRRIRARYSRTRGQHVTWRDSPYFTTEGHRELMSRPSNLPARLIISLFTMSLVAAACGSSSDEAAASSISPPASTTSTSEPVTTTAPPTTTTVETSDARCPEGMTPSPATVVGVEEYVRIRLEATTASAELGRLNADSSTEVFADSLNFDGSEYWWVAVQIPGSATCGRVAAKFLSDQSGRMDQQIPGLYFLAPTASGTWTYADRISLRDPIEGSLDGAFFTQYSLTVSDGLLIDQLLADQLSDFQAGEYDYPAEWNSEVDVPGADRAVRLITVVSGSGDVADNRLLIEVGDFTIEARTSVYIEDLDLAPLEAFDLFLESIEFDRAVFLQAISS